MAIEKAVTSAVSSAEQMASMTVIEKAVMSAVSSAEPMAEWMEIEKAVMSAVSSAEPMVAALAHGLAAQWDYLMDAMTGVGLV